MGQGQAYAWALYPGRPWEGSPCLPQVHAQNTTENGVATVCRTLQVFGCALGPRAEGVPTSGKNLSTALPIRPQVQLWLHREKL